MFNIWKKEQDNSSNSIYMQDSGSRMHGNTSKKCFYCHRSRVFTSKGNGQRALKVQGSCKINSFCTAHMKVSEDIETGEVFVNYCDYHTGHDNEMCHLRVPEEVRMSASVKLHSGVSIGRILDDIRNTVDGTIERQHLMSRQDIHNIQYQLNLQCIEKHSNDYMSVSAWVAEMQDLAYNPVLVFKNQGDEQGDECDNIGKADFLLAFQTEYQ